MPYRICLGGILILQTPPLLGRPVLSALTGQHEVVRWEGPHLERETGIWKTFAIVRERVRQYDHVASARRVDV
jgi:hypothetical protein